ncbi:MAG: hypothetical protein M3Q81_02100 [bacterium]|nr:hypothetical protein [bacterium]
MTQKQNQQQFPKNVAVMEMPSPPADLTYFGQHSSLQATAPSLPKATADPVIKDGRDEPGNVGQ